MLRVEVLNLLIICFIFDDFDVFVLRCIVKIKVIWVYVVVYS